MYNDTAFHDLPMHQLNCIPRQFFKWNTNRLIRESSDAREFKQIIQKHLHLFSGRRNALHISFDALMVPCQSILFQITKKATDGEQRRFQIM